MMSYHTLLTNGASYLATLFISVAIVSGLYNLLLHRISGLLVSWRVSFLRLLGAHLLENLISLVFGFIFVMMTYTPAGSGSAWPLLIQSILVYAFAFYLLELRRHKLSFGKTMLLLFLLLLIDVLLGHAVGSLVAMMFAYIV